MLSWKLEKTTKAPIRAELGAPAGERVVIDVSGDQVVVGTSQTERCTLSVVVPTRNEALNVEALVSRLRVALDRDVGDWEVVFVDDSDDATPEVVTGLAARGLPVRLLHRPKGQRTGGLGGAVSDGFAVCRGDVVAVMDADLQHPPEVLPALVAQVLSGEVELSAGSRYRWAGAASGLSGPWRRLVSGGCRVLVHGLLPVSRGLEDPLSGLFALRRASLDGVRLHPAGYKILLEVAVRVVPTSVGNIGFDFAPRHAGSSKASLREGLVFFSHLARLVVAGRRPLAAPRSAAPGLHRSPPHSSGCTDDVERSPGGNVDGLVSPVAGRSSSP